MRVLAFLICACAFAQSPEFEVATIKQSPLREPGAPRGTVGCGSRDAGRYTCSQATVSLMAMTAYGLKPYQLRRACSEDDVQFNVVATLPSGATTTDVPAMLRKLLADRFQLVFHYEK